MPESKVDFDFEAAYRVEGYGGVAWHAYSYESVLDENYEWTGIVNYNKERVNCYMIGDDRTFTFDISDLTVIPEDEFCHECGQIGCTANG